MFGFTVGFSGSADRMALFPVSPNPRAAILENSNGDISAADHPIRSNGAIAGFYQSHIPHTYVGKTMRED